MTARVKRKAPNPKRPKLIRRELKMYPPPAEPEVQEGATGLHPETKQRLKEASWPAAATGTLGGANMLARYLQETRGSHKQSC